MKISLNKKEIGMLLSILWKIEIELKQKIEKYPEAIAYQKAYKGIIKTTNKFNKAWRTYKK